MTYELSRRDFLTAMSVAGFGALVASTRSAWGLDRVTNPLAEYPDRGWEHVYRDLWNYDSHYTLTCAPNDTHNCLLRRLRAPGCRHLHRAPTMGYGEATDLAGRGRVQERCGSVSQFHFNITVLEDVAVSDHRLKCFLDETIPPRRPATPGVGGAPRL